MTLNFKKFIRLLSFALPLPIAIPNLLLFILPQLNSISRAWLSHVTQQEEKSLAPSKLSLIVVGEVPLVAAFALLLKAARELNSNVYTI